MDKAIKRKIFMFSALIGAMLFYMIFFWKEKYCSRDNDHHSRIHESQ